MTAKKSKFAVIIGSMNCMPTEYAKVLEKRGWIVTHYSDASSTDSLSNPFLRMKGVMNYTNLTIHVLRFLHPLFFLLPNIFHRNLLVALKNSDLIILSGAAISLARLIKKTRSIDVLALGYGDDISVFCNEEWPISRLLQRNLFSKITYGWLLYFLHVRLVALQRRGLRSCTHVAYFPPGFDINTDNILNEIINKDGPKRLSRYSINVEDLPKLHESPLLQVRASLKVMFPVRFSSSSDIFAEKGWRNFIDGVAAYTKLRPEVNVIFFCFNKGDMVDDAKRYAKYLDIDEKIRWLDVVPFEELFSLMNDVDVIIDQLGSQWLGVGMWGAILGKPIISNLSNPLIKEKFKDTCFLDAASSDQFASQLTCCELLEFRVQAKKINTIFAIKNLSLESEFDSWELPSTSSRNSCEEGK